MVPYVAEHPDHDYFETLDSNEASIKQWHQNGEDRIHDWVRQSGVSINELEQ